MLKWLGAKDAGQDLNLPNMLKPDKRFSHKEWSENAVFDYLKQSYLLTSGWMQDTVNSVGEMDPKERRKAAFYTRYFVEAMNPANFFALNPEVLEATVNEKGENLVRGLKMMLADLERGKGKLLIRQTDMDAFEVGRNTAVSPGAVVFENDLIQLIQYAPATEKVYAKPLLIIPPWINKFYILDLNPKKSMVKWLTEQGHTVFVVSWVNPDRRHGLKTWEDYMFEGGLAAIDAVLAETGQKSLHLASYCVGGTMAGTLMAYLGKIDDKRVASTTFFTAQLDFEDAGELQIFVDEHILEVVGEDMEKGYMPADRMANAFNMLRANDLIWGYVVNNYMLGKDPFPFDLLYWNADFDGDAGAAAHRFYLNEFYIRNAFAKGELRVRGVPITLADIKGPVYHVATREDHIAPAASVYRGAKEMKRAKVRFVLSGSGHIAGVINPPVLGKYQVLDQTRHVEADARGVAAGRRGDARKLVARLARLAGRAVSGAGPGARARRAARRAPERARVLRQGALRQPGAGPPRLRTGCGPGVRGRDRSGSGRRGAWTRALTAASTAALPSGPLAASAVDDLDDHARRSRANSAAPKPRVVPAGVPRRTPEVTVGGCGSNGMPFLLQVMLRAAERGLGVLAGHALRAQVDEHQVGVGAAGDDVEAALHQRLGERLRVPDDLRRVVGELRAQRLAEGDRLGGDHVHQRAALQAGEDRRVDLLRDRLVVGQDHAAARAAQRLVRGRGDDVGVRSGFGCCAAGDQAGEMRHVDHQVGADLVGDLAEAGEVDLARDGRAAGDDELRAVLGGELGDRVVVEALVLLAHAVVDRA